MTTLDIHFFVNLMSNIFEFATGSNETSYIYQIRHDNLHYGGDFLILCNMGGRSGGLMFALVSTLSDLGSSPGLGHPGTSHPGGEWKYTYSLHATGTGIISGLMSHLARKLR